MLVIDLEGKESKWKISGKSINIDTRPRSSLHKKARVLLKGTYPTLQILEEVSIRPNRKVLYLDFYIPLRKTCVEVHGQQHYKFTPHFHSNRQGFLRSKINDREKEEWCVLNKISFIVLKFDEVDSWKDQFE